MFDDIRKKSEVLQAQIKALRQEAAAQIKPLLQAFMKDHPEFTQVKWRQYTPYFNDGNTCRFSVHDPEFYFGDMDLDDEGHGAPWAQPGDKYFDEYVRRDWKGNADLAIAAKKFSKELSGIDDSLEECFGDHCQVIVRPEGVEVEEYEHD